MRLLLFEYKVSLSINKWCIIRHAQGPAHIKLILAKFDYSIRGINVVLDPAKMTRC